MFARGIRTAERVALVVGVTAVSFAFVAAPTRAAPTGAAASCAVSAPATARVHDAPFDGDLGLAPELQTIDVRLDDTCRLVVAPALADRDVTAGLIPNEGIATYVDTDADAHTGSAVWGGADVVVVVAGVAGADRGPRLGRWTGRTFSFAHGRTLVAVNAGGFRARLFQLGITRPRHLSLRVGTSWVGPLASYQDSAPDDGAPSLSLDADFVAAGVSRAPE